MRMMPSRYTTQARPVQIKRAASRIQHISAPLKGLSLSSKLTPGDPLTAAILTNFVVEDDRIEARAGHFRIMTHLSQQPIVSLIPFYGKPAQKMAAGTAGVLVETGGGTIGTGFGSNDWSWTSHSDLGSADYTVMVNGINGVWSWNGTSAAVKETITPPASKPYIIPDQFQIVLSHMNRLWFADSTNLAVYYLPLQQKSNAGGTDDELKELPLNAMFRRGGSIRAMATWTSDGGAGLDDRLVIFSSNGECVIYAGTDPDTDFQLIGIFRFDSPMSKHCVVNYGGELYALISTGLVPMSTMIRAESEQLGKEDRNVISFFLSEAISFRGNPGWQVLMNPSTGRLFCNIPQGGTRYTQMIRHMPRPVWSTFTGIPARCWGWLDPYLYFGDDRGGIYLMHPQFQSDNGQPITVDVQPAWSLYKSVAQKHFKMVLPHIITDGRPRPFLDFRTDYDISPPVNQPDVTEAEPGAIWDTATWDEDYWAHESRTVNNWQGVAALGRVGAPRLTAAILNCQFAVAGFDVLYEPGAAL